MAHLLALHFENGDWDVFVVEGLVRGVLDRKPVEEDVTGRRLPAAVRAESLNIVKSSERLRLANELRGFSKERRQQFYLGRLAQAEKRSETNP